MVYNTSKRNKVLLLFAYAIYFLCSKAKACVPNNAPAEEVPAEEVPAEEVPVEVEAAPVKEVPSGAGFGVCVVRIRKLFINKCNFHTRRKELGLPTNHYWLQSEFRLILLEAKPVGYDKCKYSWVGQ